MKAYARQLVRIVRVHDTGEVYMHAYRARYDANTGQRYASVYVRRNIRLAFEANDIPTIFTTLQRNK